MGRSLSRGGICSRLDLLVVNAHGEGFERASGRAQEGREGKGGHSERDEAGRRGRRGTEASQYVCRCRLVITMGVPAGVSLRECRLELRWGRRGEGRGQKVRPVGISATVTCYSCRHSTRPHALELLSTLSRLHSRSPTANSARQVILRASIRSHQHRTNNVCASPQLFARLTFALTHNFPDFLYC